MKKLNLILAAITVLLFRVDSQAQSNQVYLDQQGANSTITILQSGSGNKVGLQNANATISGTNNSVTINQVGDSNTLALTLKGGANQTGGNTIQYSATGNSNSFSLACGDQTGTACKNNQFTTTVTNSSSNSVTITANAQGVTNTLAVSGGDGNALTMTLNSDRAANTISTVGALNVFTVNQDGVAGTNGHKLTIDSSGNSNTFGIVQNGTIDTTVGIKNVGNSNTFSVTTHN
jgi:hypothetical protein